MALRYKSVCWFYRVKLRKMTGSNLSVSKHYDTE